MEYGGLELGMRRLLSIGLAKKSDGKDRGLPESLLILAQSGW